MAAITLGSWASHVVSFNAYTDAGKYIAFMIDGDAAQATYIANIDHVRLDSIRACQSPVSVKTANVTHDGATIVWEPLSQDDNKFQIQISTVNVGSKTEDADTISTFAADTVVTITDGVFSHTVTGLAERTDYYVYFRAVCADNSSGERYAQQVKFRTVCQIPAALPFVENFNSYGTGVGIIPECWTVDGTATNKPYCHTTHYGASGASLYFTSAAKTIGYAVLPELEAPLNTTQVSFMGYKTGTSSEITIGALTDPTDFDTFDSITTVTTSLINTWEEITVPLNGYTGTGRHLVFLIGTAYYFNIDNVIVELIPTCPRPASITVSNITDVSAEISVVSAGVETLWNLKYGPYGFNPETGGTLVSGLTATRHTLAGLLSSSHYEVYMQADCRTDGVSSWRGPADFYTEQAIELLPIISDFETDADAAMWRITSNGKANCFAVGSAERNNSSRALYISNDGGVSNIYTTTETAYSYATRKVSLPGGKYSISFDWKGIGEARYDLLRLFLIPASVSLTTGSEYGMSSGTNTTPAGWQDLGNDVLLGQSEWKTNTDTFMIEAGIYQLAFFWKNDNYGSVGNPPAAVDNVRFEAVECFIENLSVNNVTTTSANLSWISDAGTYQVIVDTVTHTTTELDALPTDVFYSNTALTTSALSLSVSANAYYYCYVRGVCDAAKTTEWKMVTFSTPTTLPLITGFEDATDNAKWQFSSNGGANGWVTGSASGAVKGGSGALYISNDGGSYDLNASSTSYAYAYRKIMVEKKGLYDIRFDWKAVGEGNYDLARVFLVPASEDLSTGNHFEMTGTRNATPNGWLDLGSGLTNGLFKGQSNWQSYAKAFALSVGEYQLAFFWKNDDGGDKAAPATIDNFRFKEGTCYAPVISMDNMEGTMVDISISSDVTTWQVIMDTVTHTTTELDALPTDVVYSNSAVTSNSLHLTGLSAVKLYHFYVRGVCGAGTYSPWAELVFSLPTALPFRADFEDPADNAQWQIGSNGGLNNWAFGTAAAKSGSGMYISNDGGVSNQYTINGTNSASYTYAYRKFFLDANSSYLLDFSWNGMGESYADIMRVFLVPTSFDLSSGSLHGMTTSGGSEATFPAAPAGWLDLVDPVTRKGKLSYNLTGEWQDFAEREVQVPTSDIYQLAFFWKNDAAAGAQPPAAVDDIFFRKILCATPIDLTASVAEDSVIIDWKAAQGNSWRLVVSSSAIDPETERGNVLDTVVNAHPVVIKGLSPSSTYNYYVQNHCIGDSLWSSEEVFTTPCGVSTIPFIEDFSSTIFPPNCWGSYEAEAASMFENTGKLAPLWLSGWKRATTGFGIARPHAVNNVYGLVNNWLITPTIHIGSSAVLLFDLAVTGYNNGNTVPAKQSDDRFMVIVSADAGNTWNSANATVWDNRGSSFVYDQIPNVAQRITIDLSPYSGQDVNIAFYSESTIIDSDNDLHIGNVEIATLVDVPVTDETCQEYDYAGFDVFSIPGTELTTAGKFSFSEYKNVSPGRYERLNLNLTVNATKEYNIAGTLCDGNSYSENGFNESVAGVYHHNLISSTGCDSTVILTLTEAQNAATSSLIIIAPDELPYHYHDTVIPVGASGSHVLVFHGTTVAGCDSTHTLTVSIGVDIPFTDTQTFNLLPNPVGRGNEVRIEADFSAADRNGLTVEVFNNVGACLLTLEPESYPIRLKGFDGSGVYVVRITTGRHEVYYGKLIVQ
ncbi:MAG: fibronectin type III domain-containing protein [Prevotellaceae bacterium]|jgi:hypothetical protein|nr:fibronectin type III domain-containing protein [Prevotellaceae bacterium]